MSLSVLQEYTAGNMLRLTVCTDVAVSTLADPGHTSDPIKPYMYQESHPERSRSHLAIAAQEASRPV